MDISIFLFLQEIRMGTEVKFLGMLQDEICSGMKYIPCKDLIRNRRKIIQGIRRIRKDYIPATTM